MLEKLLGTANYRCFLLLPQSGDEAPWCRNPWRSTLRPSLDEIIRQAGSPCSVHCRQLEGKHSKEVPFGKLDWSEKSDAKWNVDPDDTKDRLFVDLEIYSPPRPQLEKAGGLPSFYCQLKPMVWEGVPSSTAYEAAVFFAFKKSTTITSGIEDAIRDLAAKLRAQIYTATLRIGGVNAFESVIREQFMYAGLLDDPWPNLKRPKGSWERLDNAERGQP